MSHDSAAAAPTATARRRSLATPGILIGVGMGGFVDGIVLHQILQWHQMLSTTRAFGADTLDDVRVNIVADGLFHAITWAFVAVGVVLLWRVLSDGTWRGAWRSILGWTLVGWGTFNLVEGTVDHHVLQIHRVRPEAANPLAWDLGFLLLGAALVAAGWLLQRSDGPGRIAGTRSRAAEAG